MTYNKPSNGYSKFVTCLLVVFPFFVTSTKVFSDLILFALAISGLFIAISKRISPFRVPELKIYSLITIFYFFMVCLSVIFSGKAFELAHFINRELHFLFAPLIGLAIFKAKVNINQLFIGIQVALIVLGVTTIVQYFIGEVRPSGVLNANVFAQLVVTLLVISFVGFLHKDKSLKLLLSISIPMGITAMMLSGTRGALITFIICMILYIAFLFLKKDHRIINTLLIFMLIILVITILLINGIILPRIVQAINEVNQWFSGSNLQTPVTFRFEFYTAALQAVPDTPLFGYGYRNANNIVASYAKESFQAYIATKNHLHNAYLSMYIYSGIFGLLSILLLFFAPMRLFIKSYNICSVNFVALMGLMLTLSFGLSGLTSITFGDANLNGMYLLFLAYLLPLTLKHTIDR